MLEKGVIHIGRSKFLQEGACYESIVLHNHDIRTHVLETSFFFRSDFRDIFEVRGMKRERRGTVLPPETNAEGHLKLAYEGLDGISRTALGSLRVADGMGGRQLGNFSRAIGAPASV